MASGVAHMPRTAREKSESGIYHVMLRGINRQVIFQDDEDCEKYLQGLSECKTVSGFTLHAYCLMGNHLHLLIQEGKEPLEQVFKRIGVRYVYWYNWKYKRSGHLFQDRFKSEPVNGDAYFLTVLRYIYQNPVKAGLCKSAADYPWGSESTGGRAFPVERTRALELLPEDKLWAFLETPSEECCLDIESDGRLNDREAIDLIKQVCGLKSVTDFVRLPPERQSQYLSKLHEQRCSIRQMARLTGVSKAQVERMLK